MSSTTDIEQRFAYLLSPEFEIVNTAGKPLTGGWIEVYIHGTRDKYYCLSDFDGTLHPFQIPLDSLGSNIVLASPTHAYDIYIYNKFGSLVMSRYNVVPATNSPDAVADVVVIDSPDETINVTIDSGSNWHLEVNTDLIATASGLNEVSGALLNKKDKQEALSFEGAATKTVKNISQDDNGVITVEYEDIDLPQQVPNVNIISPSGTLDISSTTDPATNTKTFKIDVHKSNMDYFEGYYGRAHYEDRPSDTSAAFTTYVDEWNEYRYQGDFIANSWQDQDNTTFLLNSGLYLITASIRYKMTDVSIKNKEEYIRIATGAFNGLENGTRLKDWSNEAALDENTIQLSFVRSVDDDEDYDNLRGNHTLYFAPYLPYGVEYAEIDHLQIVKLDSIVSYHGGSGPRYSPGYGIEIQDDVISVATGDVITNNYFETVVSSINNEINELTTVVNNVSGDITNLSESVTNLIGATGDYATKDYVDAAVSGLENYSAGQYVSIEDHVINVTGVQPEGDYATNADLQTVSAAIPDTQEVEFQELDVDSLATIEYVDNRIATAAGDVYEAGQYISIEDGVIAATGLQPAGDYATEQYVDEAIAAVTGQPIGQVQSDWTQTDDTEVDYIKHKPRQVNLVAGYNITIEQDGLDVIISAEDPGDTYNAGQYISIQNNTIAATGLQPAGNYLTPADLNGYATEQYVDDAVAAVTGQPITQVNSDWLATSGVAEILNKPDVFQLIAGDNIDITPSGNDLVISASSDVTKAYVDEQIDAVTDMIPTLPAEEEVEFEELNLSDYALASAIPDISDLATKTELANAIDAATGMIPDVSNFATNDDVQYVQEQVDQLVAATGYYLQASDLAGYATEQELQAVADSIPDISNLATKTEVDAVSAAIPTLPQEEEVEFEELNLTDYALASAIPDISNLATKSELEAVESEIPVVTGFATKAELQEVEAEIPDVSNLATKAEVQAVTGMIPDISDLATKSELEAVEAEIPDVSNLATKTELATVDAKVDAVSAAIPAEEEVEFEELDLSNYALASAIPDVSTLATKSELAAVEAEIPDVSNLATKSELDAVEAEIPDVSNLATKTEVQAVDAKVDTVSASIPEAKEIEFKEVDLADFALASAVPQLELNSDNQVTAIDGHALVGGGGSNVTTEEGQFTVHPNTEGADVTVIYPTDVAPDTVFYQINSVSGYAYATAPNQAVISYYYGETPADFNGSDDSILFTINDNISNVSYINFFYVQTESSMGGPNLATSSINGGSTGIVQSGTYKVKAQYNQAAQGGYGKYLQIMFSWRNYATDAAQSLQWAQEALSKITFFGVVRPDPTLGATVNLDRYALGNTVTTTNISGYTEAVVYTDPTSKKQSVYLPLSMPGSWTPNNNIAQAFEYGSNRNSPNDYSITRTLYRAYKYTSSHLRYQCAYLTDWDKANKLMTFVAYDNSGNAIEKWTLDYTTYSSNVWTTEAIETGVEYTAGSGINITDDVISLDDPVNLVAGDNVNITVSGDDVVISAQGGSSTYTAGNGIDIINNEISVDNTVALKTDIPDVTNLATKAEVQAATGMIPDTSDMATQTWVGQQGYLTAVPSTYATKDYVDTAVGTKQNTLTGITDVQVVQSLPASPVATVLYLIPEA